MAVLNSESVYLSSLENAELCYQTKNYGKAFAYYLLAVKLNPSIKINLKSKFFNTLDKWTDLLVKQKRENDAWLCFSQAIEVFPENDYCYNSAASFLMAYGESGALQAVPLLKKSLDVNRWNLVNLRQLENACNLIVDRWHYRMLNDYVRNSSFKEAIWTEIRSGKKNVLDIGTGTGLLSLFAEEAGASVVYACESSPAMAYIAAQVISKNASSQIKLIDKHSTDMSIPQDMPQQASLAVCELVDSCLFGEHVLETLIHAWDNLLEPTATVIPRGAALHICGMQCEFIGDRFKIKESRKKEFGVDRHTILAEPTDYDTENLNVSPDLCKRITKLETPIVVNFSNTQEMRQILNGEKNLILDLKVETDGTLDCVTAWFTLHLGEEIKLETAPNGNVKCWDQAIFPNPYYLKVSQGDRVSIQLSFTGGRTQVVFLCNTRSNDELTASSSVIAMINDDAFINALQKSASELQMPERPVAVLDLNAFPVFGLTWMRGAEGALVSCCLASNRSLVTLAAEAASSNIQLHFLPENNINEIEAIGELFDVIVIPAVESRGELNDYYLAHLLDLRKLLKPNGILLPKKIEIFGQIVESSWLLGASRVLDSDLTCSFHLAECINEYTIEHQLDFQLESISAKEKSDEMRLLEVCLAEDSADDWIESETTVQIFGAGPVHAIVCWFNVYYGTTALCTRHSRYFNLSAILLDSHNVRELATILTKYNKGAFMSRLVSPQRIT